MYKRFTVLVLHVEDFKIFFYYVIIIFVIGFYYYFLTNIK